MQTIKGVTIQPSPFSVKETIDKIAAFLQQDGATIYARINQQEEVQKTGQNMRPLSLFYLEARRQAGP